MRIEKRNNYNDDIISLYLEALIATRRLNNLFACRQYNNIITQHLIVKGICSNLRI